MLVQILSANVDTDEMNNHTAILMLLEGVELLLNYWNIVKVLQKPQANRSCIFTGSCHVFFPILPWIRLCVSKFQFVINDISLQ